MGSFCQEPTFAVNDVDDQLWPEGVTANICLRIAAISSWLPGTCQTATGPFRDADDGITATAAINRNLAERMTATGW